MSNFFEAIPFLGQWHIKAENIYTGETIYEEFSHNVVVKTGRAMVLELIAGTPTATSMPHMGIGASSTAATVNDTRLVHELIGNASRKTTTDSSGGSRDASDIQDEQITIDGCTFYKKLTLQAVYNGATDGNQNQPVREYGLFSTWILPGTPTGTSGTMYNRFVAANTIILDSSTVLTVNMILRS